jgi:predicted dehydrogenase
VNRPLRLGVLGCGRVFERFHLPAILRTASIQLIAACDADPARMGWAAEHTPPPTRFTSLAELLARSEIEALLVLTPPESHAEVALQALQAGLHVLVEKPMALTVQDGVRMADTARRTGRRLQIGFTRRFREPYRRLRDALQALDRASLRAVHFELAFSTSGWNAHTDFLGDETRGGGVLHDVLSHQIDLICWLLNGIPDEVQAVMDRGEGVLVELRFGTLTTRCHASHGSYADRLTIETALGHVLEATGNSLRSTGLAFPAWRRGRALLLDRVALLRDRMLRRPNVSLLSFERQFRDFEQAVHGGSGVGASAEEGVIGLKILEACRESARLGGTWRRME